MINKAKMSDFCLNMNSLTRLKKYSFKVFLAPFLKLFEVASELCLPFLVKYLIDDGIKNDNLELCLILSSCMIGIAILGFFITMIAQYLASKVASLYVYDLRNDLFSFYQKLDLLTINNYSRQKLLTLINNDATNMQNGVMMFMRLIFRPPFLLIGTIILSFVINYVAGLIILCSIFLSASVIISIMFLSPKKYAKIQKNIDDITIISEDTLNGIKPIKAFNKEEFEQNKFNSSLLTYKKSSMKMNFLNSLINPLTFLFINLGLVLIVYFGNISLDNNPYFTTGEIVSLISYLVSSLASLIMFSRLILSLNKALASKKRIDDFFKLKTEIIDNKKYSFLDKDQSENVFEVKNLNFSYSKNASCHVLDNINLTIKKGQFIGFIGPTGSGKSTLTSLLTRLYDYQEGEIYFRGYPLKEYSLSSLHQEIFYVLQKGSFFKGTIKDNLTFNFNYSDNEIINALKKSQAYEFVIKYDDFIDHEILDNGSNLSGGQKQRLLLARAFLLKKDVLILDDSTSALDFISEEKVRSELIKENYLTKILISQRATSLIKCDNIFVFDNGKIIDNGTHKELLSRCKLYQEIFDMQRAIK